jgi:signal transduction histidine kinase
VLLLVSGLEMLLLSFAVADRFAQAQRQLAEETEQRRAIEEAYADELETEVRERTRELAHANADKDRMLEVIGHDLRSPLTGLMKSADRAAGDFARDTAHTGRALLLMIEDLVLWARMRAGTRDLAAHSARALLQPAIALHRALAEHGGTELVLDVPESLRVETDLVLAQTLVRNLLANALKFARTRVVLRAQGDARDGVRFSVSNDGAPLPADVVARLAANENEPMTAIGGLGLRLCREICAALGMKLEAGVPAEGGAEFAFTLPAAENSREENS